MRITLRFLIAVAIAVPPLAATTITFDQIVNSRPNEDYNSPPYFFQGYELNAEHYHVVDSLDCDFGGCVAFTGSQYLALDPESPEGSEFSRPNIYFSLAREDGGTFRFIGFDASKLFNDDAAANAGGFRSVDVLGISGYRMTAPGHLEPLWFLEFTLPEVPGYGRLRIPAGYASVDRVLIVEDAGHSWALDNIVIADVPEPASIVLVTLALGGVVWKGRLRTR